MSDETTVYPFSLQVAISSKMRNAWLESYHLNCLCARDLELAIQSSLLDNRIVATYLCTVLESYGAERLCWVLANTVQQAGGDSRYSIDVRSWAKDFEIPSENWNLHKNFVVKAHPILVGQVIAYVLDEIGVVL